MKHAEIDVEVRVTATTILMDSIKRSHRLTADVCWGENGEIVGDHAVVTEIEVVDP